MTTHSVPTAASRLPADTARALTVVQCALLASAALVLAGTVTLVVWGPAWAGAASRDALLHRVAGAVLLGTLLMAVLQGLLLRGLARRLRGQPSTEVPNAAAAALSLPRDPLTGLLDTIAFQSQVTTFLRRASTDATASLFLIDLDRFKRINQEAGRDAGDALLCEAATLLLSHLRQGDGVARLHDDTYALLLPGCAAEQALALARRLRSALSGLGVEHQGRWLAVGATVGVAALDRGARQDAQTWMARAHAAWYEAKYGEQGPVRMAAAPSQLSVVAPA